jgi:ABC-2 type transport system ATP-binding protein
LVILNEGKVVAFGTPLELRQEIGGDVILLEANGDPAALADRIQTRFSVATAVLGRHVRFEMENGHRVITAVVEAFPGEIQSVSVSKPTLEDVFIHRTGHRFWSEGTDEPRTADTTQS